MKPKTKILYLFDSAITAEEFKAKLVKQMRLAIDDRILRVSNQAIPKTRSGQPTQLFGSPITTEPSNAWIHEYED